MKHTTKPTLTLLNLWRIAALCLVLMALPAATYGQKKKVPVRNRTTQKASPASALSSKLTKGVWVEPDGLVAYIFDAGGKGSYLTGGVSDLTWRVISGNRAVVKTYSGTDTLVVANGEFFIGRWRTPLRQRVFADAAYKAALRKTRAANGESETWPPFCYVDIAENLLGRTWKEIYPETSGGETWTFTSSTKGERRVRGQVTKFSWKVLPGNVLQLTLAGGKVEKYPLERVYTGSISALFPAFKTRVLDSVDSEYPFREACFIWSPGPEEMMEAYLEDYFDLWYFFRKPQSEVLDKLGKEWPCSETYSKDGELRFYPYRVPFVSAVYFSLTFENGKLNCIYHTIKDLTLEQRKALAARYSKNAEKDITTMSGGFTMHKYGMDIYVSPDLHDASKGSVGILIRPTQSR